MAIATEEEKEDKQKIDELIKYLNVCIDREIKLIQSTGITMLVIIGAIVTCIQKSLEIHDVFMNKVIILTAIYSSIFLLALICFKVIMSNDNLMLKRRLVSNIECFVNHKTNMFFVIYICSGVVIINSLAFRASLYIDFFNYIALISFAIIIIKFLDNYLTNIFIKCRLLKIKAKIILIKNINKPVFITMFLLILILPLIIYIVGNDDILVSIKFAINSIKDSKSTQLALLICSGLILIYILFYRCITGLKIKCFKELEQKLMVDVATYNEAKQIMDQEFFGESIDNIKNEININMEKFKKIKDGVITEIEVNQILKLLDGIEKTYLKLSKLSIFKNKLTEEEVEFLLNIPTENEKDRNHFKNFL